MKLSIFKPAVAWTMTFSLAAAPLPGWANKYERAVSESINASMERAKDDAVAMVSEDFAKLNEGVMRRLMTYARSQDLYKVYEELVRDIEVQLSKLSTEEIEELNVNQQAVMKFIERYEKQVRRKFMASWIPAEQTREYETARDVIRNMAQDFKKTCSIGRSMKGWSYLQPAFLPPEYISRFDVKVSPNIIGMATSGLPVSFSYGFTSTTGGSKEANRDRALALAITTTASNIANSILISSKWASAMGAASSTGTGVAAAFNQAMIAAAPYLAAVAIITMIVVDQLAKEEATRLNNQLQKALHRQGMETADSETVNAFYRESCRSYADTLDQVVQLFDDLEDPAKRQAAIEKAEKLKPTKLKWEADSIEMHGVNCAIDLDLLHEKHTCQQLPADSKLIELKIDPEKPGDRCAINAAKTSIFSIDGQCALPYGADERKKQIEEAKAKQKKYNEDYPPKLLVELMTANLTLVFANQASISNQWRRASFDRLDQVQNRAFSQILRMINAMKRVQKVSTNVEKLKGEVGVQRQFLAYRKAVLNLGERTISAIVGKADPGPVQIGWAELKAEYAPFALKYRHVPEVRELEAAIDGVIREMRGGR